MTEPSVVLMHGHVIDELRKLPAESVQMAVTSPPYWGLRDYSRCGCVTPSTAREAETNPQKEGRSEIAEDGRGDRHTQGGAIAFYRSGIPDPNCPKCHGRGRDESLDVVWDAAEGCGHEWVESRYYTERSAGSASQEALSKPGESNADRIHDARWRTNSTCSRCGAWRGQLGLEPTYDLYLRHMVQVFRELRRVLRSDGTVWLNLGDCYATGAAKVGDAPGGGVQGEAWKSYGPARMQVPDGKNPEAGVPSFQPNRMPQPGLKPKDLVGMPWRVALALQDDGWWLRSDIIWHKPNPMPESIKSRPTKAHEYLFLLAKSEDYFYDSDAIREPILDASRERGKYGFTGTELRNEEMVEAHHGKGYMRSEGRAVEFNQAGRNARTVWTIPTAPYPEAHFATFPPKLVEPCIKAGTSQKGACGTCGAPMERVVDATARFEGGSGRAGTAPDDVKGKWDGLRYGRNLGLGPVRDVQTLGWAPTCDCMKDPCQTCGKPWIQKRIVRLVSNMNIRVRDAKKGILFEKSGLFAAPHGASDEEIESYDQDESYREEVQNVRFPDCDCGTVPCMVLDPFSGSGTVGQVARELRRSATLIEIKEEYIELAKDRINIAQKTIGEFP